MTPTQATPEAPTPPPADVLRSGDGQPSLLARREIHAALQAETADALAAFEEAKAQARRKLIDRFGIDANQLDRIEAEADREGWPPWDGLADERGPIPTFGPVKTDRRGRLIVNREEDEARQDAIGRMLRVIGKITDESDSDEIWDQLPWGREESR